MKPWLLFYGLICVLGLASCKKDLLHWQTVTQVSSSTNHRLNRILFVNDTLGFIAGGDRFTAADILTTHDGGRSFRYQTFPDAGKAMYDIIKAPSGSIYAVGYAGQILASNDNGATWEHRSVLGHEYKSVTATATGNLIIIGGINFDEGFIYRCDEGNNFQSFDTTNYELNQIRILPDGSGYRCGYGTMGKTTDNGNTWQLQELRRDNFVAVDVRSADEVWTCGYNGSIYHTLNGGADWQRKRNGNDLTIPRYRLQDILFTDAQNGYAVGEEGVVIYTDDGGDHWMEMDRFTAETLHSIAHCPDGSLLVCGEGGVIYRVQKK